MNSIKHFRFVFRPCDMSLVLAGLVVMSVTFTVMAAADQRSADAGCCKIIELRQYSLKPSQRDVLIDLFDREFVETQEADGMRIVGQFSDEDNPDHFVWIRGFANMDARRRGLAAFYSGPAWKRFGKQAAETMIDSNNVLLLRPVKPAAGFDDLLSSRPPIALPAPGTFVVATIYHLKPENAVEFPAFFRTVLGPSLQIAGVVPRAAFETEQAANNYPALPIREGEHVFVWFASFERPLAYANSMEKFARMPEWNRVQSQLQRFLDAPTIVLRLRPTRRSLLR
jgi:hypothetical protein